MPLADDTIPVPPLTPGVARALSPLVRRITCESDGDAGGHNTYLVGIDEIVVVDPGPSIGDHLDIVCGCGGDRIRWILSTKHDADYVAGAEFVKKETGAELIAPTGFADADQTLGDGFKIDATEFRLAAVTFADKDDALFAYVLEQERTLLTGAGIDMAKGLVPSKLIEKVKPSRIKSIAPGYGQFIEDARPLLK